MSSDIRQAFVHARHPDGNTDLVGLYRLVVGRSGRTHGEFEYVGSWLRNAHGRAFPLDPENLPLASEVFRSEKRGLLPGALADATPDRWGRRVLELTVPADELPLKSPALLLATNDTRVGCLAFSHDTRLEASAAGYAAEEDLQSIADAFERLDRGEPQGGLASKIWTAGLSLGGARPKATIIHEGQLWIAKFQRRDDLFDQCAIEHAAMRLAGECGIGVAKTRIVDVGPSKAVLVKRFDRSGLIPSCHYLSAMSALGLDESSDAGSYSEIAHFLARHAADQARDRRELFRRMLFNVLCGNRDDHLKNHALLRDGGATWRLSPAFDIVPQPDFEAVQAIGVGKLGSLPTIANCLSNAGDFDVGADEAKSIVDRMIETLRPWRRKFAEWGVPDTSIARMQSAFSAQI